MSSNKAVESGQVDADPTDLSTYEEFKEPEPAPGQVLMTRTGKRTPRIESFCILGAILGGIIVLVWGLVVDDPSFKTMVVLFSTGAFFGAFILGVVALIWEKLASKE